jgi:hypothetical protein
LFSPAPQGAALPRLKYHVSGGAMNWKLIFGLSLFGLAMSIATVFWIPMKIEPLFWLVIFVISAYLIAKKCTGNYFLHGFLVSIVNSVWVTGAHVALFKTYMGYHPNMARMNAHLPMMGHPRMMMLIMGPLFGALFGVILGLFAFIASKLVKK